MKTFYENGKSKEEFYKNAEGQLSGVHRFWNESGLLLDEEFLLDGKKNGTFKQWHENGQLSQSAFYINGLEHGTTISYNKDGSISSIYNHNLGKLNGRCKHFNNGHISRSSFFINGLTIEQYRQIKRCGREFDRLIMLDNSDALIPNSESCI